MSSHVRVLIAATNGGRPVDPVEIENLIKLGSNITRSAACVGRSTTRQAGISNTYDCFVRGETGVIQRDFGGKSWCLELSSAIDVGDSWQLGAYIAHAAEYAGRLAKKGKPADIILVATGEVHRDLSVTSIDDLAAKVNGLIDYLTTQSEPARRLIVAWPKSDHEDVDDATRRKLSGLGAEIIELEEVWPLLKKLGLRLPASLSRRRLIKIAVASVVLGFVTWLVAGDKPILKFKKRDFIGEPVEFTWTPFSGKDDPDVYKIEHADNKDFQKSVVEPLQEGTSFSVPSTPTPKTWWRVWAQVDGVWTATEPVQTTFYNDVYDRIEDTGHLRVTLSSNRSQGIFKFIKKNGKKDGVDVKLAEQITQRLSHKMNKEIKEDPAPITAWENKLFDRLGNGETDVVIAAATKLKDRETTYNIKFSNPYFCTSYSVVYKVQNLEQNKAKLPVRDLIKGKTIGYPKGTASEALIDKLAKEISFTKRHFDEIEEPIQRLLTNSNVQFALTDTTFAVARVFAENAKTPDTLDYKKLEAGDFPPGSPAEERRNEYAVAVYQAGKKLLTIINETILDLEKNGDLPKMIEQAAENYKKEKLLNITQEQVKLLYKQCPLTAATQDK